MGVCVLNPWEVVGWREDKIHPNCRQHKHITRDDAKKFYDTEKATFAGKIGNREAIEMKDANPVQPKVFRVVYERTETEDAPATPNYQLVPGVVAGRKGRCPCKTTKSYEGRSYTVNGIPASGGRNYLRTMRVSEINQEL